LPPLLFVLARGVVSSCFSSFSVVGFGFGGGGGGEVGEMMVVAFEMFEDAGECPSQSVDPCGRWKGDSREKSVRKNETPIKHVSSSSSISRKRGR